MSQIARVLGAEYILGGQFTVEKRFGFGKLGLKPT